MRTNHIIISIIIGALFIYVFHHFTNWQLTRFNENQPVNFVIDRETGLNENAEKLANYFTKKNEEIFYVVYNRVAKCGSTTTYNLLEKLSKTNNFENVFHYEKSDKHQLTDNTTRALTSEFRDYESSKNG